MRVISSVVLTDSFRGMAFLGFLAFVAGCFVFYLAHFNIGDENIGSIATLLVTLGLMFFIFGIWQSKRLKTVILADSGIIVKGSKLEISIPFQGIEKVYWHGPLLQRYVTILFHQETKFGKGITFIAAGVEPFTFKQPSIIRELENLIARRVGS